jgi:superoxide dismutase, Fe-Mn family
MKKREFLKTSAILGAGALIAPSLTSSCMNSAAQPGATASLVALGDDGIFVQPSLDYAFDALEPHMDAATMEVHYGKHHAGYTKKFNAALEYADFHSTDIYKLFSNVSTHGKGIRNNGGGYFNHNLYWKFMSPEGGGEPAEGGKLAEAIAADFGSFAEFKDLFSATAASHFGSGWGWLLLDTDGKLQVTSLPNQDNPLMDISPVQGTPLLNIDVWEHAYYLHYQNMRKSYIEAYWNVIDWKFVEALYLEAIG